ncbi:hypothetical protein [Ornithinimicrobium panacihumi]|uniref:hypothetical protein n=1 Tax=Ornithinimicrobium panacihumi TaxID=2008449 RepID=UPI003F8CA99F
MSSMTKVGVYTVEDLHAYREARRDWTVQLIDGELIVGPGPGIEHQDVLVELLVRLREAALPGQLPAGRARPLTHDRLESDFS